MLDKLDLNDLTVFVVLPNYKDYVDRFQMFRSVSSCVNHVHLLLMNGSPESDENYKPIKNFTLHASNGVRSPWEKLLALHGLSLKINLCRPTVIHDTFFGKLTLICRTRLLGRPRQNIRFVLSLYSPNPHRLLFRTWDPEGEDSFIQSAKYYMMFARRILWEFMSARLVDFVTGNSPQILKDVDRYYRVQKNRLSFIPTEVGSRWFKSYTSNKRENEGIEVLFVGNIGRHKGVDTLLRSLCSLKQRCDLRLILVGCLPDSDLAWFWNQVEEFGLRETVELNGRVDQQKLIQYYRKADILVCPSRVEGSPRVVKEAAACGCCVIATRIPGITSIDPEGTFITFVDPDNSKDLSEKISNLIEDPLTRHKKSEAGRAFIERKFSSPCIVSKVASFYYRLF